MGRGGQGAWVGQRPMGAALSAWVRYGVEFLPAAVPGVLPLSEFSPCFLFPSLSDLRLHNSYLGFRVCLSGLHNNALGLREVPSRLGLHNNALGFCVRFRHDLVCITMPLVLREIPSRLGLHNNALGFA